MVDNFETHPTEAVSGAHEKFAFFWEVQNRKGLPSHRKPRSISASSANLSLTRSEIRDITGQISVKINN